MTLEEKNSNEKAAIRRSSNYIGIKFELLGNNKRKKKSQHTEIKITLTKAVHENQTILSKEKISLELRRTITMK